MPAIALKVDSVFDIGAAKDMVTSPRSLLEPQPKQEAAQILEIDASVGSTEQDPVEKLAMLAHVQILSERLPLRT